LPRSWACGARLHSLRHYSATELIAAGVDIRTVAGSGGATTLKVYAGWVDEAGQRAATTMGGIMPPVVASFCVTAPGLQFDTVQAPAGRSGGESWILDAVFAARRAAPLITVLDRHPHTLAFLAEITAGSSPMRSTP